MSLDPRTSPVLGSSPTWARPLRCIDHDGLGYSARLPGTDCFATFSIPQSTIGSSYGTTLQQVQCLVPLLRASGLLLTHREIIVYPRVDSVPVLQTHIAVQVMAREVFSGNSACGNFGRRGEVSLDALQNLKANMRKVDLT